jgi:hypothetical protein
LSRTSFIWAYDWPLAELAALPQTFRLRSPHPSGNDSIVVKTMASVASGASGACPLFGLWIATSPATFGGEAPRNDRFVAMTINARGMSLCF